MSVDLTKLILDTPYSAFKNNNPVSPGILTINGSTVAGVNTRTFTVNLVSIPDMVDIVFNGPTGGIDPRPAGGWFKRGAVWVPTNNVGGGSPSLWNIYSNIVGSVLTVTGVYIQQFTIAEALTSTDFSYRVMDYSVF